MTQSKPASRVLLVLGGLAAALAVLSAVPARAEPLDKYTGYTRPGTPAFDPEQKPITPTSPKEEREGLGVTVYFKVLDNSEGVLGDVFGTGYKDFDEVFVPGREALGARNSPKLDGTARYLYLYQVVNDSGRDSVMSTVGVELIVPPEKITSWGHFAVRKPNLPARGLAFTYDAGEARGKRAVRLVSQEFPGVTDKRYQDPAPHYPPPHEGTYNMSPMLLDNIRGADEESLDVGREPEAVLLVPNVTIHRKSRPPAARRTAGTFVPLGSPYLPSPLTGYPSGGLYLSNPFAFPVLTEESYQEERRGLAVRAFFRDDPLKPGQRSTIFGFTSDLPPTFDLVRWSGRPTQKIQLGEEEEFIAFRQDAAPPAGPPGDTLAAEGSVPTPIGGAPAAPPAAPIGTLGGLPPGGGGGGGGFGGVPLGGVGGGFASPTSGIGSAAGGGSGGGNGNGTGLPNTSTQGQNQNQPQTQSQNTGGPSQGGQTQYVNLSVPVTANQSNQQSQSQQQRQRQSQRQKQSQNQTTTQEVIPEPAAVVSALLGLPMFFLLGRRLRRGKTAAPAEPAA
jgi:hypothetical protein